MPTGLFYKFKKTKNMKPASKKNIMLIAFITIAGISANAQKLNASKVPEIVKASFAKQYPGVNAAWEKEGGKYEAGFKKNNTAMSILFEPNGTMTESEISIKISDLPVAALAYVNEHYKGKTIKEGAKITKADGTINFEAEVNGNDVIFDARGNFLKVTKD